MFNTYIYDNKSVKEAAHIIAKSNKEHDNTLKHISEAEIKSKDRVDIPLSEYLEMRRQLERLEDRTRHMQAMIISMGIPAEVIDTINPASIHVETCEDIRDFQTHYRVSFTAEGKLNPWR